MPPHRRGLSQLTWAQLTCMHYGSDGCCPVLGVLNLTRKHFLLFFILHMTCFLTLYTGWKFGPVKHTMDFIKQRLRQDDGQTSEPRGRSPISLEDHLPQPVDDHTIAEKVKTLKDFVETHVHQFYRAADEADDYASDDENPPQSPEDASSMSGSQHELFQTAYDRTDHAPSRYHDYQRGPSDHTPSSHQYPEYQQPRVVSNHQARFSNDQFQQPAVDYSYPQAQPDYTRPTSDYTYHQSDYSSRPTIVDRGASRQAPSHQSRRGSAGDRLSRSWRKEVHRIVSKTLIERINPYGDEPETFLPREIVQFLRALPQGENTDGKIPENVANSRIDLDKLISLCSIQRSYI